MAAVVPACCRAGNHCHAWGPSPVAVGIASSFVLAVPGSCGGSGPSALDATFLVGAAIVSGSVGGGWQTMCG
eukprot:9406123-Pyramimonas_sp.AAC.1